MFLFMSYNIPYRNRKNNDPTLQGEKALVNIYLDRLPRDKYNEAMCNRGLLFENEAIYNIPAFDRIQRIKRIYFQELTN